LTEHFFVPEIFKLKLGTSSFGQVHLTAAFATVVIQQLQKVDDFRVWEEVDTGTWEQRSILIPIFKSALPRLKINCLFFHQRFLMLLFLDCDQPSLQILHNLEEVFKTKLISFYFHAGNQINGFGRFSADFGQDGLDGLESYKTGLVLVKYVENSAEVFNLALGIDREDIDITTQL